MVSSRGVRGRISLLSTLLCAQGRGETEARRTDDCVVLCGPCGRVERCLVWKTWLFANV